MSESESGKANAADSSSTAFVYSSYTAFNRQNQVVASASSSSFSPNDENNKKESLSNDNNPPSSNTDNPSSSALPQLLPSDPNNSNIPTVTLGGDAVSIDALGPIVINLDGSTSRIDNWGIMTEREKEVTKRRIAKRNKERREMLLEQLQQQQQQQEE